jgi:hypothetical protein
MHTIRLRGPWEYEPLENFLAPEAELPPPGKITMPADWGETLGPEFRGRVRYTRFFHLPTNLEPHERVWLEFESVDCAAHILLNEHHVGAFVGRDGEVQFDVTMKLQPRNRLDVVVELPQIPPSGGRLPRPAGRDNSPGGLIGEVRLRISAHPPSPEGPLSGV